jgi:hypothetical protein
MKEIVTEGEAEQLRRDAMRWRELQALMQASYDGDDTSGPDNLAVYARMVFGRGDFRRVEVTLGFDDTRDEPLDLGSVLDARVAARR